MNTQTEGQDLRSGVYNEHDPGEYHLFPPVGWCLDPHLSLLPMGCCQGRFRPEFGGLEGFGGGGRPLTWGFVVWGTVWVGSCRGDI